MNTHLRAPDLTQATTAQTRHGRRRWTLAEAERMVAAGIVHDRERIELIDGDLITMSPKGRRHEIVRLALGHRWTKLCSDDLMVGVETLLSLDPHTAPEPDLMIYPSALFAPDVRGDTVLLVVEVADSSLSYDLTVKAQLYASFCVREYWVIDPTTLDTTVHRGPSPTGYADIAAHPAADTLTPTAVPSLAVRLADLNT